MLLSTGVAGGARLVGGATGTLRAGGGGGAGGGGAVAGGGAAGSRLGGT